MNPNKIIFTTVALALATQTAYAEGGSSGSHGGNGIVCFDSTTIPARILRQPPSTRFISNSDFKHITSVKALDLFEAESQVSGLDIDASTRPTLIQPLSGEKHTEFLKRIADRYSNEIPLIKKIIQDGITSFTGHTHLYSGGEPTNGIAQVFDIGELPYVVNRNKCVLATIAQQSGNGATLSLDIDGRFGDLNLRIYSDLSRKTIQLHEVVYLWARGLGHQDSKNTRALVGKLLQLEINRDSVAQLLEQAFTDATKIYAENSVNQEMNSFLDGIKNRFTTLLASHHSLSDLEYRIRFISGCLTSSDPKFDSGYGPCWSLILDRESMDFKKKQLADLNAELSRSISDKKRRRLELEKATLENLLAIRQAAVSTQENKYQTERDALLKNRAEIARYSETVPAVIHEFLRSKTEPALEGIANDSCGAKELLEKVESDLADRFKEWQQSGYFLLGTELRSNYSLRCTNFPIL